MPSQLNILTTRALQWMPHILFFAAALLSLYWLVQLLAPVSFAPAVQKNGNSTKVENYSWTLFAPLSTAQISTLPAMELLGVVESTQKSLARAAILVGGNKKIAAIGEEFVSGVVLQSVETDAVTVTFQGQEHTLKFAKPPAASVEPTTMAPSQPNNVAVNHSNASNLNIKNPRQNNFNSSRFDAGQVGTMSPAKSLPPPPPQ